MGELAAAFDGRIVVVTGAGGGIGRALSVGFSAEGATVVGIGHRANTLEGTAQLCRQPMTFVRADLSIPRECSRAIEEVVATHGRIDVLINNAGVAGSGAFLEKSVDDWSAVIALNVLGVAACCHAALPQMIRQGSGRIISMTSRMALSGVPGTSAYGASKAAIGALTRSIAAEITPKHPDVLINELIPGPTKTGMCDAGQRPEDVYPFVRKLALLPRGGPSGRVFFRDKPYSFFGLRHTLFRLRG